ncbi:DUF3179 domain-containing (seleno)protein [Mucilaginibacter sp. L3T2-6]|uniref:DUF3179 domain-containing (seleno)protein n=1 Tax=Mucilaginibacter sp. L3T2-6 TaxID=3062491 RepID=UPI0026750409|nr:DUF3179 domain-containing (seleno)protein [Mucilaginibacter sp. L3T2-6]MDO3642996.1 DUF3179 domain-containing (seleno)protein [Mucilaginibacter sp. L3T2-6]MDV6215321.1 DUF3179 domain-containing (seleno)protein [Mucilaginibacter sp. L3T2-6]
MNKAQGNAWIFWTGFCLLLIPGLVHAYLLMPFPGSQDLNAITVSYYLEKVLTPLRLTGSVMILYFIIRYFRDNSTKSKLMKLAAMILFLGSFYLTDVKYKAETMFEEPKAVVFANAINNHVPESMVILGVVNNGVAKAYPLVYLGYHHKVQDNVGGEPVLVTYCTMCRTGRVYSPVVNGRKQLFRLVGARHYNAIIEDSDTKTWWYQATGAAAVGPLKGKHLKELYYEQSTLVSWLTKYPGSLILQPDQHFTADYTDLKNYDRIQSIDRDSMIKNKDTIIQKSWVVGVIVNGQAKAYNWRPLVKAKVVNDNVGNMPLMVGLESDSLSFHAYKRVINGKELHLNVSNEGILIDRETGSTWNWNGLCVAGPVKGAKMDKIQAYQEYLRSWRHFHPKTLLQ